MSKNISSIPVMLSEIRYNKAELARTLNVTRNTITKYESDINCDNHIVVRGRLMVVTSGKRK